MALTDGEFELVAIQCVEEGDVAGEQGRIFEQPLGMVPAIVRDFGGVGRDDSGRFDGGGPPGEGDIPRCRTSPNAADRRDGDVQFFVEFADERGVLGFPGFDGSAGKTERSRCFYAVGASNRQKRIVATDDGDDALTRNT